MDDGLDAARALLPGTRLRAVATLKSGERSTVRRVQAVDPDGAERSLIVKEYLAGDEGWVRESAALASVPGSVRVPALVAVGEAPQLVVMEDLGDGMSVAETLLGDDPRAAADALVGWAAAIADLHVATRDSRAAFRAAVDARRGDAEIANPWAMASRIREAERVLDRDCGSLGVAIPTGALDELTGLVDRLGPDTNAALTPADTCPANNVRVGRRRVLIDFEGAQWRHIAWDVAYLLVPWPTCPCAWRNPDDVAHRAVAEYRRVAAAGFPDVAAPGFAADVEAAAIGWALVTAAWSLDHALGSEVELDQQLDPKHPGPSRRALIMHRLRRAAGSEELPALAELAGGMCTALARRWGDVRLELAPAFRAG